MLASSTSEPELAGLQALRGIAASLVYIQHVFAFADAATPGPTNILYSFQFGGLGVYIFFALSAYLMATKVSDPPLKFVIDRVRRIYPTFWIVLIIATVVTYYLAGTHGTTWQLFLLLPMGERPWANVPYWTLYFELTFYAFMLLLIVPFGKRAIYPAMIGLLASFALSGSVTNTDHQFPIGGLLFFNKLSLYFLAGIVAGLLPPPKSGKIYAAVGLAAFYGILHIYRVPGVNTLIGPYIGVLLAPVWAFSMFCFVRAALAWSAEGRIGSLLARLGDLSYGIYLIHLVPLNAIVVLLTMYGLKLSYWQVAALMFVSALPPAIAMGLIDLRLQKALKGATRRLPMLMRLRRQPA